MEEGIEYLPTGSIIVRFDGAEYRLGRPKLGTLRWFDERISTIRSEYLGRITQLRDLIGELSEDLTKQKKSALEKKATALREAVNEPFWETTKGWIAEAFKQLGDKPLPEDYDTWPAWLATDTELIGSILTHWKSAPKASGGTP